MNLNPPRDLHSIALIIRALPADQRAAALESIHDAHLNVIEGPVFQALYGAIRNVHGEERASAWQATAHPARYTLRDTWLEARRQGVEEQLLEEGFERPEETQATFRGRLERLKELHAKLLELQAEEDDLARDLATCRLPHAVTEVSDAIGISRATGYRRYGAEGV